METAEILVILHEEREDNTKNDESRQQAIRLLEGHDDTRGKVPDLLLDLLNSVIKPLFSTQKHAALTSTGRKQLVAPPPSVRHFDDNVWDEDTKPWKNGWTDRLLLYITSQYSQLPESSRRTTVEAQFHLLVPPVLNMIDDGDIAYKTKGCMLLKSLCQALAACQSGILKRTGLTEVFVDAMKTNFLMLPTLTPEDESLALMRELYPAFRSLITATYPPTPPTPPEAGLDISYLTINPSDISIPSPADKLARQSLLTVLLRHGILTSYSHASDYIALSTFLLQQTNLIVSDMGIHACKHLQTLLPLLRNILSNPFGSASPELLAASLDTMQALLVVCWPRIKEKWWGECLRACVACWMTTKEDEKLGALDLEDVRRKVKQTVALIADVAGDEFEEARHVLGQEEALRDDMFAEIPRRGDDT